MKNASKNAYSRVGISEIRKNAKSISERDKRQEEMEDEDMSDGFMAESICDSSSEYDTELDENGI